MSNPVTKITRCAAGLLVLGLILPTSCRKETPRSVDPIAHTSGYDIWPDSIDLHDGVILRAMSDSVMQVRVDGNILDTIAAGKVPSGRMTFSSTLPLLDFLYRLEASAPSTGRYTTVTPYEIYLNPLQNDSATDILKSRMRNGLVTPFGTRRAGWPAINSNAEWLLAASELLLATGDSRWEKTVRQTARAAIASDTRICRNTATGLFTGIPRHMAYGAGMFPRWMTQSDIFQQSTLAVNVAYAASMSNLGLPADSLADALKRHLWIPGMGCLSATAYGVPACPLPLPVTDNLAQSVAILSGIIPDAMADAIIRKTPVGPTGVSLYQPMLPPASGEIREGIPSTLLQTAWTVAAARQGNEAAYSKAVGDLFATEGKRLLGYRHQPPAFRSAFTTLITRGLLGMRFSTDGIHLVPYVPENMPGEKTIGNLRYRNVILDIKITGTGKVISTFTIDGTPSEPFIPAGLEGRHQVAITLAGATADPGFVTIQGKTITAPLPPEVDWTAPGQAVIRPGSIPGNLPANFLTEEEQEYPEEPGKASHQVYVNGILREETTSGTYRAGDTREPAVIQFTTLNDSKLSGFSSKPYIGISRHPRHTIQASSIAKTGTKILETKALASKFVESNRFKNRNISFGFDSPEEGRYLVDVHYANGLGIVNSQRKIALRSFRVNGREAGVLIFPQLSAANAPRDDNESWQEMTTWSNTLIVDLKKGENRLELRYYQPSPVYSDPNSNVVLFDLVRLTPVN